MVSEQLLDSAYKETLERFRQSEKVTFIGKHSIPKQVPEKTGRLIEKKPKTAPKGLYYYKINSGGWAAIDNVTQEGFNDAFETKQEALKWLKKFYQ